MIESLVLALARAGPDSLAKPGVRTVPLDSTTLARHAGVYRLGAHELLEIMPSDAGDGTLFFSEPSGRAGRLVAISPTEFVAGPNLRDRLPVERRAEFITDARGDISAISWRIGYSPETTIAPRVRVHREEIRFASDTTLISGTLTRPCGRGPWPAIVLVHGSGPATRDQFGTLPQVAAALGIACLAYDKRGCGRSTGRYHDFLPIDVLAGDAVAAIRQLAGRADIDSTRIGLWGASQGGWVVARTSERRAPAFVVLQSASTLGIAENQRFEIDHELRAAGFAENEVREARRLNELFHRMILRGGTAWDTLRTEIRAWRHAPWFAPAGLPDSLPETPSPGNLRWVERLRGYFEYDPLPALRRLQAPVLAFYGGRDRNVPAERSAAELRAALASAGARDVTVVFDPDADHWLWRLPASGQPEERSTKIDRLGARLAEWLVRRARPPATRPCPH